MRRLLLAFVLGLTCTVAGQWNINRVPINMSDMYGGTGPCVLAACPAALACKVCGGCVPLGGGGCGCGGGAPQDGCDGSLYYHCQGTNYFPCNQTGMGPCGQNMTWGTCATNPQGVCLPPAATCFPGGTVNCKGCL
jgi:hypothetical protein